MALTYPGLKVLTQGQGPGFPGGGAEAWEGAWHGGGWQGPVPGTEAPDIHTMNRQQREPRTWDMLSMIHSG